MIKRREIQVFSISFLDLLSGALGAVIILFIAVPKAQMKKDIKKIQVAPVLKDQMGKKIQIIKQEQKLKNKISGLQHQVFETIQENNSLKREIQELNNKLSVKTEQKPATNLPVDVGFKFKGKKIIFIIDVSGSMFYEDRIGQVKAGLKMLITSMSNNFAIDVVHYPNGNESNYNALWSSMMETTQENKLDVYEFLHSLRPYGPTPTRDAIAYVLENYHDASDIVLLSDGAPTVGKTNKRDSIKDLLKFIKNKNTNNIQINTIGVGSNFLKDVENDKYVFLNSLAKEHKGFFVGF